MQKERSVFKAIADPTRRQIIGMLTEEAMSINGIAEHFTAISRPAVSKHIKVLTETGLVEIHQDGRERFCYIQAAPLKEISDWVHQYEQFWNNKLDNLGNYLDKKHRKKSQQ